MSNGTRRTKYYLRRKNRRSRMHVRDAYSQHTTASREHTSMQYHTPVLDIQLNQYLFLSTISSKQERSNHGTNSPESAKECPKSENAQPKLRTTQPSLGLFFAFRGERGAVTPLEREILWATRARMRPSAMPNAVVDDGMGTLRVMGRGQEGSSKGR